MKVTMLFSCLFSKKANELRPCPICKNVTLCLNVKQNKTYFINCEDCGFSGKRACTIKGAVKKWNWEADN